jgi:TPR repeat protein
MSFKDSLSFAKNFLLAWLGGSVSAYEVAQDYLNGIGTKKNVKKGMRWIETAAERGQPDALYISGHNALNYEDSGPRHLSHMKNWEMHTKGLKSLVHAGLLGHNEAQIEVASYYKSNKTYICMIEAASWYTLAANNSNPVASKWLAENPQYAKRARKFNRQEIELIRAGMLSGSPMAVYNFAKIIFDNDFTYDVYADAIRLLLKYSHWVEIDPYMFDCSKIADLHYRLVQSASFGDETACFILGGAIECSIFDFMSNANDYYTQAAEKGNADACYRLGLYYKNYNAPLSEKYFLLAKEYGYLEDPIE